ncbi:hypothetical protein [Agromyces kandeliae]|uniref:CARDB domain-containing protein n=1 Tax=Agromyces kandeliae TaxID=2666141 RepID=A0A6L5QWQ7_9MICO|nr:hypothetical protein [Agromyces kandeliae]MRX42119.1 hypothetical protein [Agromyces kandeliae]
MPSQVVSWLSPAIVAGPYQPGETLEVAVQVRNSGDGNSASIATVVVYWADPTVGFAQPEFFGATTVAVPPARTSPLTVTTPTMRRTIPASAPDHICLLAAVHHPQDRAGTVCDPVGDRHWAQRNLTAVTAQPGAPAMIPFDLANPTADDGEFVLLVRRTELSAVMPVVAELGAELSEIPPIVTLHGPDGRALTDPMRELSHGLSLAAHERVRVELAIEPEGELSPDAAIVAEAVLLRHDEQPVGSLGFVLRGA